MAKKGFLFALLFVALINSAWAFDFYAVCSTGQTLYYTITDASNHYVETTHPGSNYSPWVGYTKPTGSMTIPSSVSHNGVSYSVKSIGSNCFIECTGVTSITIPSSVTTIQEKAFYSCSGITSMNMGNSVTTIGDESFAECSGLASLNLGSSVSSIGNMAFQYCTGITSVFFPNSLTTIGNNAFAHCGFSSLSLPNSVIHVGYGAFSATPWFDNQPNGIVYAGLVAYSYKGTMPSNTSVSIQSGTKSLADHLFFEKAGLVSVSLPSSLIVIGNESFYGCPGLTSITIPTSVTYIGTFAFYQCGNLHTVNYNAQNCTYMGGAGGAGSIGGVFEGCASFNTLNIGNGVVSIPANAFNGCTQLANVSIPNSVTAIHRYAFYNCSSISSITIGSAVSLIGENAFGGCSNLTTINYNAINCINEDEDDSPFPGSSSALTTLNIGSGVQIIPASLFEGCSHISSVSIPNSVHSIKQAAFSGCSSISLLSIGNSVTSIESHAFSFCSSISSINIPNSVTTLGSYAFYNCSGATSLSIGNSVQAIPEYAFFGCSGLSSVTIPNSVVAIGDYAFRACSGITAFQFGNAVTSIGSGAFMQCSSLSSLSIGNAVTSIGDNAFMYCTGLTSVTIPASLTNMASNAFFGCSAIASVNYNAINCTNTETNSFFYGSSITSFHIGNGVESIPRALVMNCPNLTGQLVIPNTVTSIGGLSFSNCGISGKLTIPSSVTSIANTAFAYCTGLTEIEVLSQTPPSCGTSAFAGCYDTPLIVPCGCVSAYQNSPGWSNFTNIQQTSGCSYQVNASANPSNGGTVQGSGIYNQGQSCTLVASANTGFGFVNWTENGSQVSTSPTYSFPVTGDRTLVANFQYQQPSSYTITASASPANGGTISGTGTYDQGATCTLSATPSYGYVFLRWTENGNQVSTNPTYSFTVNGNRTLVANFQYDPPTYTISASANPANGGSVSGAGTFIEGQVCTLTASPNSGFVFLKWTENGTQVSTNPTYSFTVNSNRTLVAHFQSQPSQYTVTLSANPNNGGSVSGGGTYNQGQTCNITANANPNYSFENWTENGTQVSANSTYSFTVTGNRTLVANFSYSPTGYVINATAEPSYGGLVSGAGTYNQGRTCTLIATPNPNYDFVNWTEGSNVVSANASYSFTVNGNRTLVAHFESQVYTISVSANPSNAGTVYGGGDYSAGITCHLIAVPNSGCSFLNWTENGVVVASDPDYSFVVTGNRDMVANFLNYDDVNELEDAVSVYPNPTRNKVYIKGNHLRKIEVFNALGMLVVSEVLSDSHTEIDLQHLSAGIYCLRVYTEEGAFSQSVVKE